MLEAKTDEGRLLLAVLCDGMGGLDKGEVASAALIRAFEAWFQEELPGLIRKEDPLYEVQKLFLAQFMPEPVRTQQIAFSRNSLSLPKLRLHKTGCAGAVGFSWVPHLPPCCFWKTEAISSAM